MRAGWWAERIEVEAPGTFEPDELFGSPPPEGADEDSLAELEAAYDRVIERIEDLVGRAGEGELTA